MSKQINFLKYFIPDEKINNVAEINLQNLQNKNIKLILIDLDNTLLASGESKIDKKIKKFILKARVNNFKICILSNSIYKNSKVKKIADLLEVSFISPAFKPFSWGIKKALKKFKVLPENVAIIGDQLLTDILGGNLHNFYTILVNPLSSKDFILTKLISRNIEKMILNKIMRKTHYE